MKKAMRIARICGAIFLAAASLLLIADVLFYGHYLSAGNRPHWISAAENIAAIIGGGAMLCFLALKALLRRKKDKY